MLLSIVATVLGWNLRSLAEQVALNSEHRIAVIAADEHIKAAAEQWKKKTLWLENSVRAIHAEQRVDRDLLNRIAQKVGAEGAPPAQALPSLAP